jgi:hypothetical protein
MSAMTEPAVAVELGEHDRVAGSAPSDSVCEVGVPHSRELENARSACRSLVIFGVWAGRGFAALGLLRGALPLIELAGGGPAAPGFWVRAGLHSLSAVLAFTLAGWGVTAISRLTAAVILGYLEAFARLSDHLSARVSEGLTLLERMAEGLAQRSGQVVAPSASGLERARSIAEIVRAAEAGDWVEVETRLSDFEADFPEDPELSSLKKDLTKSRDGFIKNSLGQLEAARAVSDADRVLEIYQHLLPSLDPERRATLDPELAKWFLGLIHRRLRVGKVQVDVVQLAARFAESFGATVEGASVRASLPTLRRSVGLCPRCAPNCKKGATHALLAPPADEEANRAE